MIIPTLLSDSVEDIQQKIDSLVAIPNHPTHLQLDVIDGLFADNITLMPVSFAELNFHGCTYEVHLMVNDPEDYLGEVKESGAKAVITQIEHLRDRNDFITVAKQLKLGVGLALDLYTPVSALTEYDLMHADLVLLMSVKAGFSGASFHPLVYEKIIELRARNFTKPIEIDGGVNASVIPELKKCGASHLAVNSALWQNGAINENLDNLMKASVHAQNT